MHGKFYVYIVFREDGSPCYVGKGTRERWRFHLRRSHNKQLRGIVERAGGRIPIVLIRTGLSEKDAHTLEVAFIAAIGRFPSGPLVNMTDGSEGMSGHKRSAGSVERQAAKLRGRKRPQDVVDRIATANRGQKRTDEIRAKLRSPKSEAHRLALSRAKIGRKQSAEHVEARISALRGRERTFETRVKVRAALLGKKHTAERRANQRSANRSREPEVRARIAAATRAAMARLKQGKS